MLNVCRGNPSAAPARHLGSPLGRSTLGWGERTGRERLPGVWVVSEKKALWGEMATQQPAQDVQDRGGPEMGRDPEDRCCGSGVCRRLDTRAGPGTL